MREKTFAKRHVLVTGGAGFIAFHLTERLLRAGTPVVALDNFDPFYPRSVKERNLSDLRRMADETGTPFIFREMDLEQLSQDSFSELAIDEVIHLAAKAGVRPSLEDPVSYGLANVQGTLRVLEFCRARGIRKLVFGSSSSVYGNDTPVPFREDALATRPVSPYAASKRACELFCESHASLFGIVVASLRFFTVYGPRQRPDLAIHKFMRLLSEGKPLPVFGDGSTSRDYTFVSDIVDGIMGARGWAQGQALAGTQGRMEIFNLGGSSPIALKDLIGLIERASGRRALLDRKPPQSGDVERTYADVSKSRQLLGYEPRVPLETGLRLFAEWFFDSHARGSGQKAA
jgi:UDP-glucuronate 4-epimerase